MQVAENAVVIVEDRARFKPIGNVFCSVAIGSPHRGAQSKFTLIRASDRILFVRELENWNNGPELFAADNLVFLPRSENQRGQQEMAVRPFSWIELPAFRHHFQIRCTAAAQQSADKIELSFVIERAHRGLWIQAITDNRAVEGSRELIDQFVVSRRMNIDALNRHAYLSRSAQYSVGHA